MTPICRDLTVRVATANHAGVNTHAQTVVQINQSKAVRQILGWEDANLKLFMRTITTNNDLLNLFKFEGFP